MKEINIICVGDLRYRFNADIIKHWDFDYNDNILRIDFKDGSFIEFYKRNIICVEYNTEEGSKDADTKSMYYPQVDGITPTVVAESEET